MHTKAIKKVHHPNIDHNVNSFNKEISWSLEKIFIYNKRYKHTKRGHGGSREEREPTPMQNVRLRRGKSHRLS